MKSESSVVVRGLEKLSAHFCRLQDLPILAIRGVLNLHRWWKIVFLDFSSI